MGVRWRQSTVVNVVNGCSVLRSCIYGHTTATFRFSFQSRFIPFQLLEMLLVDYLKLLVDHLNVISSDK